VSSNCVPCAGGIPFPSNSSAFSDLGGSLSSDRFTPDRFIPDRFIPDRFIPDRFIPDHSIPDRSIPRPP